MLKKPKVVLFYPHYDGPPLSAPVCLLALASPLLAEGFDVCVIDAAIQPDAEARVLRECRDAICVGISVLTGPMIRSAIRVADEVKKQVPSLTVIFGGWHPSLLPTQTLEFRNVDFVVRGQGEITFLELVRRIADGRSLAGVEGSSARNSGMIQHGAERKVAPLESLPMPAFHLAKFDEYERASGVRKLSYATSVGCPYACNYCTDMVFYKRRFNALSAERVVAELTDVVPRYRIDEVALLDSNFPVDLKRAIAIARGIYESGVRFRWTFQASTDFLSRMSDAEVSLMAMSGVTHMGFGTESTSTEVLHLMNKRHQRLNEMYETARKAQLGGIHVTFNLIFGYPGETEEHRVETLRTMSEIAREFWNVSFSPNIFTPYPGIPIWPQLRELGVREPASLLEWADIALGHNVLPWLQGQELRRLRRMLEYFLVNNQLRKATLKHPCLRGALRRALGVPLRWRIKSNKYSFPWELWIARKTTALVTRRSLLTGQPLSAEMSEVC